MSAVRFRQPAPYTDVMIPPVRLRKRWLHEMEPITGKSIEIDRRSWAQGLFEVSALSVVVNAQADALV